MSRTHRPRLRHHARATTQGKQVTLPAKQTKRNGRTSWASSPAAPWLASPHASPEAFKARIAVDIDKWTRVVDAARIERI
jgi:hypothetical protein